MSCSCPSWSPSLLGSCSASIASTATLETMGKKGTKRKTKWRALPLGEEAGGSGNEEDLHDEDQSTTSSIVGGQLGNNVFKRQPVYFKMADKPYRQTRRFTCDRFRCKEPLVKLESKTFDEEEYTKITTPRQDVLFKKGYFGRKRESSVEETTPPTEMDGEEPLMDQIIITNGFVDERGHYLVNGNSYEIYDPYSNTVTVVVGPPPYANGVTHPVLAAVSCQPVPLQPVDWYPPGADWPSQGSAWTPSFPRNPLPAPAPDPLGSPDCAPAFSPPEAPPQLLYDHPPFLLPPTSYLYNGVPPQTNAQTESQNVEDSRIDVKNSRRKSTETVPEEIAEAKHAPEGCADVLVKTLQGQRSIINETEVSRQPSPQRNHDASDAVPTAGEEFVPTEATQKVEVEKQNHSTQTNLPEDVNPSAVVGVSGKESHSTQTPSVNVHCGTNAPDVGAQPKNHKPSSDIPLSLPPSPKSEGDAKERREWKSHGNRYNSVVKKFREDFPKIYQQRGSFVEERKMNQEKVVCSPTKVSYAKKAMTGLEGPGREGQKGTNVVGTRVGNGLTNGLTKVMANGVGSKTGGFGGGRVGNEKQKGEGMCEEKRNGFVKAKYGRGRTTNERSWQKYRDKRAEVNVFEEREKKYENAGNESRSQSEKSSTVSELSSPTELSSGQNTPPEKLIVQKMEQEINKSFEVKLKQNLKANEDVEEDVTVGVRGEKEPEIRKEENVEEKSPEKAKNKKKKSKGQVEAEKPREGPLKGGKRRKKRAGGEAKEKAEEENSGEEMAFLSGIRETEALFERWGAQEAIPEMDSFLNGDAEILKSLGLDGRIGYSKLPLHSDLLMILPGIGWSRPKLKIEDFFAPTPYDSDLFTKKNITNMKSTKPEEFFASVVDSPVVEKSEKKKESSKRIGKSQETPPPEKKTAQKKTSEPPKRSAELAVEQEEDGAHEGKLGIVEAVNTWLQEQGNSEKVLSVDGLDDLVAEVEDESSKQKNGEGNPIHALSAEETEKEGSGAAPGGSGCIRVANVVNDGFVRVRGELKGRNGGRMYRSSSWDAKLSEVKIKKHFKFLTDSASFCQDLISDVRNGLPTGNEYATEELCDPKQIVRKYYTLAPGGVSRLRRESDSENEVYDALEYKFFPKDKHDAVPDGKASITDSGVHSDVDFSEDAASDHQKERTCKLQ